MVVEINSFGVEVVDFATGVIESSDVEVIVSAVDRNTSLCVVKIVVETFSVTFFVTIESGIDRVERESRVLV
jgi:hypothetical protein